MGVVFDMPDTVYHSRSELSSTGARQLLDSPARFRWLQDHPQPHRDAFDLGTAVHSRVLGVGAQIVTYPAEHLTPSGAPSTKAATVAWADEQRANGAVVISASQAAHVSGMAEAVLAHGEARTILEAISGREVSLFAEVEGVQVRARFDLYDGINAVDLKTSADGSPEGFNRAVWKFGYHIQDRWYTEAHTAITGNELESFKFIVVEKTAPYLVAVYDLDYMWEDIAKERTARARDLYRRCTEAGTWPGYVGGTLTPQIGAIYENSKEEIRV